jgi:hypothetical protein
MKGILGIIALLMLSTISFSQTKRIAHRSHSGKNSSFTVKGIHNFGEIHEMRARKDSLNKVKIDTVKKPVVDTAKKLTTSSVKKWKAKKVRKPITKTTR